MPPTAPDLLLSLYIFIPAKPSGKNKHPVLEENLEPEPAGLIFRGEPGNPSEVLLLGSGRNESRTLREMLEAGFRFLREPAKWLFVCLFFFFFF